jgi:hypothetical protein
MFTYVPSPDEEGIYDHTTVAFLLLCFSSYRGLLNTPISQFSILSTFLRQSNKPAIFYPQLLVCITQLAVRAYSNRIRSPSYNSYLASIKRPCRLTLIHWCLVSIAQSASYDSLCQSQHPWAICTIEMVFNLSWAQKLGYVYGRTRRYP